MEKTVVELDLKGYSDIARELEEHFSAEIVMQFNEQIQAFVDAGLKATRSRREDTVVATTGDGAIVVFDAPATGHRFGEVVHEACQAHNHGKSAPAARRWFRIGIATGEVVLETLGATRKMAGSVIARAVRLEAAANIGEILADTDTYAALPREIQAGYGAEERIAGKRDEVFTARRCVIVPGLHTTAPNSKGSPSGGAGQGTPALAMWKKRLDYLEEQFAIVSGAAQKFELKCQIEEAREKILEFGG
ncbi:MAG: adenylate/guanylate cyclase domain-containing protein [Gammaproteobacteria bacterium]